MKRIAFSKAALKTLKRVPANTAEAILSKIKQYAADPKSLANNVKKLQGRKGYRLRVGDWRIIFNDDGTCWKFSISARVAVFTNEDQDRGGSRS